MVLADLHATIEQVGTPATFGVEDWNVAGAGSFQQRDDMFDGVPGFLATVRAVLLDTLKDVFGLIAAEVVLHVDYEQGGAFAETAALAITRGLVYELVAFRKEVVPDTFALGWCVLGLGV